MIKTTISKKIICLGLLLIMTNNSLAIDTNWASSDCIAIPFSTNGPAIGSRMCCDISCMPSDNTTSNDSTLVSTESICSPFVTTVLPDGGISVACVSPKTNSRLLPAKSSDSSKTSQTDVINQSKQVLQEYMAQLSQDMTSYYKNKYNCDSPSYNKWAQGQLIICKPQCNYTLPPPAIGTITEDCKKIGPNGKPASDLNGTVVNNNLPEVFVVGPTAYTSSMPASDMNGTWMIDSDLTKKVDNWMTYWRLFEGIGPVIINNDTEASSNSDDESVANRVLASDESDVSSNGNYDVSQTLSKTTGVALKCHEIVYPSYSFWLCPSSLVVPVSSQ